MTTATEPAASSQSGVGATSVTTVSSPITPGSADHTRATVPRSRIVIHSASSHATGPAAGGVTDPRHAGWDPARCRGGGFDGVRLGLLRRPTLAARRPLGSALAAGRPAGAVAGGEDTADEVTAGGWPATGWCAAPRARSRAVEHGLEHRARRRRPRPARRRAGRRPASGRSSAARAGRRRRRSTVFSIARARTRVRQWSTLRSPATQAAGTTSTSAPRRPARAPARGSAGRSRSSARPATRAISTTTGSGGAAGSRSDSR